ncbi:AAA family ATPase [Boudabousia marimammalium]|uniref:Nuclease SbcCD subunit C n=1 Tax=Boudabousia marimammalium TaxID=156892 RepID=A0A1Q5PRR4_9ACTO|nr:SMC family ATPase [Boudabousia marimammalium]OKL50189.1 hypothetical protein BM477_02000 [Boudabousia marimammalium]
MRLLKLTFAGIGPFPGEHTIDFESAEDSGLFLLEGPTGSGKSTIIDAITFALFNDVAGEKDSSKDRIRSDFCAPSDASFVRLTFSVPRGTYVVERTPQFLKPGNKSATPGKATLWRVDSESGVLEPVATKSNQVGAEMSQLLPLKKEQFLQTVVLPQGKFNTFLSAESGEREKVLRTIFGTEIYTLIIEKLKQQAHEYQKQIDASGASLVSAYESLQESISALKLNQPVPELETPDLGALKQYASPLLFSGSLDNLQAELAAHVQQLEDSVEKYSIAANEKMDTAKVRQDEATSAHEAGKRLVKLLKQREEAISHREALASQSTEIEKQRRSLQLAHRAELVQKALTREQRAETKQRTASEESKKKQTAWNQFFSSATGKKLTSLRPMVVARDEENLIELEPLSATVSCPETAEQLAGSGYLEQIAESLLTAKQVESEVASLEKQIKQAEVENGQQLDSLKELEAKLKQLPDQLTKAKELRESLTQQSSQVQALELTVDKLQEVEKLFKELGSTQTREAKAEKQFKTAEAALVEADAQKKLAQTIWEEGAAARLAKELDEGAPCPVCGSKAHPSPAEGQADSWEEDTYKAAQERLDKALAEWNQRKTELDTAKAQEAELRARIGERKAADTLTLLSEAQENLTRAHRAKEQLPEAEATQSRLEEASQKLATQISQLRGLSQAQTRKVKALTAQKETATKALSAWLSPFSKVSEAQKSLNQATEALSEYRKAEANQKQAENSLAEAQAESRSELLESPFKTTEEAQAARLTASKLTELEEAIKTYDADLAKTLGVLESEEIMALPKDITPPDLAELAEATQNAQKQYQETSSLAGTVVTLTQQAKQNTDRFQERFQELADYYKQNQELLRVSALAQGRGSENDESTSLSTYVLLSRLEDILAHANPILSQISGGRYQLARTHKESRQQSRSAGLGLEIIDHQTGHQRSTKTLSGGEGFYTSLSLALALSSVVTSEAGGINIETMFIDEGFGTLSPEYLDQVISELHKLSKGGTTIGLISHVKELQERIADRITIRTNMDGHSTLKVSF